MGRLVHACTHTTFAPTVAHGGTKTNVIPDHVELEVDIRTLPGQTGDDSRDAAARRARRPADSVDIESNDDLSTASPIDTPLWDTLSTVTGRLVKDSALVPFLMVGGTDNRFFRRAGAVGYGFGLFSKRLAFEDYATMFHGNDERVDVESLGTVGAAVARGRRGDVDVSERASDGVHGERSSITCSYWNAMDKDAWLALFADDVEYEDPPGTVASRGVR